MVVRATADLERKTSCCAFHVDVDGYAGTFFGEEGSCRGASCTNACLDSAGLFYSLISVLYVSARLSHANLNVRLHVFQG
jgi:hypothetical protein